MRTIEGAESAKSTLECRPEQRRPAQSLPAASTCRSYLHLLFGLSDARQFVEAILQPCGVKIDGERPWDIQVKDYHLFHDVALRGTIAVGEGFVKGRWDCAALDEMIFRVLRGTPGQRLLPVPSARLLGLLDRFANRQIGRRSTMVVRRHYEREAAIIEAMIGPLLCYSCGYWANASSNDAAQEAKLDLICRKLALSRSDRVLDIGSGYGAFARHAAERHGCRVVGITLSPRQAECARKLCQGLPVDIRLMGFQESAFDALGPFDKIVSIGMFEHVGRQNYQAFFAKCSRLLTADGLMLLHTIGRSVTTAVDPWVDRYVFPNGYLPELADFQVCCYGDLVMEDLHNFGNDYSLTLMAWHRNLADARRRGTISMDETTYRFWTYYLLSFAGAFRARRRIQLWQIVFAKGGRIGGYRRVT